MTSRTITVTEQRPPPSPGLNQPGLSLSLLADNGGLSSVPPEDVEEFLKFAQKEHKFLGYAVCASGTEVHKEKDEQKEDAKDEGSSSILMSSDEIKQASFEEQLNKIRERQAMLYRLKSLQKQKEESKARRNLAEGKVKEEEKGENAEKEGDSATNQQVEILQLQLKLLLSQMDEIGERLEDFKENEEEKEKEKKEEEEEEGANLESSMDEWVLIPSPPPEEENFEICRAPPAPSFFDYWPSFGVEDKLEVVARGAQDAVVIGVMLGARYAIESVFRLISRNALTAGAAGLLAAFGVFNSPQIALAALQYVVIGGVIGGVGVAAPILIVGSGGVFAGATMYHSFILSRRLARAAVGFTPATQSEIENGIHQCHQQCD